MRRFGAFGKVPALGDFLRGGLPAGFADPWDRWLQEGLVAARSGLGDRWQACYFSAPIWRFTLASGLAGPTALQGVVMPSVDRVGRQFPLTLVAAIDPAQDLLTAHLEAGPVFAALEAVALAALEDDMTAAMLAARLRDLAPASAEPLPLAYRLAGSRVPVPAGGLAAALSGLPGPALRRPSIWSAILEGETRVILAEGMPTAPRMADLFDMHAAVWMPEPAEGAPA